MTSSIFMKDINDLPLRTPPIPGIPVKTLLDENNSKSMRAGLMSWSPGARSATQPHYHSIEEFQLVVNGRATLIDCNGDTHPLRPGSVFLCPSGLEGMHAIHNTSDLAMTLLFVYPRQDFETIKPEAGRSARLRSSILIRNIDDIKSERSSPPMVRAKTLCGGLDSKDVVAEVTWLEPGARLTGNRLHYHSAEEFQLVLYGTAELADSDGRKHVLRDGMMTLCPAGAGGAHSIENTGDFPMSLLTVHPVHQFETSEYPGR